MTEENKEVVEETTDQPIEETIESVIDETKFDSAGNPDIIKIDLDAPPPQPEQEEQVVEEVKENVEQPVAEQVIEEVADNEPNEVEKIEDQAIDAIDQSMETGEPLPENIQKLVNFMEETGGDIQDYVNLNRDLTGLDDSDILDEYYRSTKSHLSAEERNFLLEDTFGIDEELDDEKTIRKKKIALKEQVAEARAYLDGQKSKYYEEIKAGSRLTPEQQEAINFYNKYNEDSEQQEELYKASHDSFLNKTNNLFNDNFKGFEYNVGNKKYRFNVKDVNKVKTTQSDLNNFINKFVGEDNSTIEDAEGYHKSLFTAMNADAIAKHFYEQGMADATKERVAKDKNITLDPRQTHGETNVGGVRYRVLGDSSSDMKNRSFKIRKKN